MTDWAKLKVVDLKAELKQRGLAQHGLKNDLIARLADDDEEASPAEDETEDAPMVDEPAGDEPLVEDTAPADPEPIETAEEAGDANEKAVEETVNDDKAEGEEPAPVNTETNATEKDDEHEQIETIKPDAPEEDPALEVSSADVAIPGDEADAQSREQTVEEKSRRATTDPAAESAPSYSLEATPAAERQKRKRRSLTPPPTEEAIAHKRARVEEEAANGDAAHLPDPEPQPEAAGEQPPPMSIDSEEQPEKSRQSPAQPEPAPREEKSAEARDNKQEMDYERDVGPAVHPATPALYIKNLMRPLRPQDVKAHLVDLATPPRDGLNDDIVVEFFLDQIRTHAFVVFKNTAAAARVRTALHDSVWPNESNRKPLWVDFVPPEKVRDWIDTEQASGGSRGRSGARWEVVYEDGPAGAIEAHLDEATSSMSRAGPPPGARPALDSSMKSNDSIPLGPRGFRDPTIPTGPRPVRPGTGPGPRPPPINTPGGASKRTQTRPVVHYQPVSEDLARRRLD
ncbi:hypothetical protein FZEAL_8466, partial [Fusarium zealandicum]